jgi:hypothetical protein
VLHGVRLNLKPDDAVLCARRLCLSSVNGVHDSLAALLVVGDKEGDVVEQVVFFHSLTRGGRSEAEWEPE